MRLCATFLAPFPVLPLSVFASCLIQPLGHPLGEPLASEKAAVSGPRAHSFTYAEYIESPRKALEFYRLNGYLVVVDLLPEEVVQNMRENFDEWWRRKDVLSRDNVRVEFRQALGSANQKFNIMDRLDPAVDLLSQENQETQVFGGRLPNFAAAVMQPFWGALHPDVVDQIKGGVLGESVQLLRSKYIRKEGVSEGERGGLPTPGYGIHRDGDYWREIAPDAVDGIRPHEFANLWVALEPADRETGALEIYPRTHLRYYPTYGETGALEGHPQADNPHYFANLDIDEERFLESCSVVAPVIAEVPAGAVVALHYNVVHRTGPNTKKKQSRNAYLPTYIPRRRFKGGEVFNGGWVEPDEASCRYYEWYIGLRANGELVPSGRKYYRWENPNSYFAPLFCGIENGPSEQERRLHFP